MARMAKNNTLMNVNANNPLVDAINRMAEAQEKQTAMIAEANNLYRQGLELNLKQYTLNIDNHKHNLEQVEIAEKRHQEAREENKEDYNNLVKNIKTYVDEMYNNLWKATQEQVGLLLSSHHELEKKLAEKADQNEVAQSIAQRMMKSIKGKGTI